MTYNTVIRKGIVLVIAFMMAFTTVFTGSAGSASAVSSTLSSKHYSVSTGNAIAAYMKSHQSQPCTVSVDAMLKKYYGVSTTSYRDGLSAKCTRVYAKTCGTDTSKLRNGDVLVFYTKGGSTCHVGIWLGGKIHHTGISSSRSQGCTIAWWLKNDSASHSWSAYRGFNWTVSPPTAPGQVAIRLSNGKGNIIQVRWNRLPKNVTNYWVYRKTGDGDWERAATVSSQYGYCNVKVDYNKQTYFKVRAVNQKKINGKLYRAFGRMSAVKTTTVRKASTAVVKAQASAQGAVQDESLDISQAAVAPADQSDAAAVQITVPADDQAAEEAGVLISSPETDDQPAE
jgi:hypothetical protein